MPERLQERVAREFPGDVAEHVMTARLDDGVYRHLECRKPGTRNRLFTITTWPGELCISGDMGTFVFSRLHDMFAFFRTDRDVNPSYWSQKLVGVDRNGFEVFDPDTFVDAINECLEYWLDCRELSAAHAAAIREAVRDEVLSCARHGEHEAYQAAMDFESDGDRPFAEFYRHRCREYTYHFLWCCHAIRWAIRQWDALRTQMEPPRA